VPREARALDASWVVAHPGEDLEPPEVVVGLRVELAHHELVELVVEHARLVDRLSLDVDRQHRSRGLRDGAPRPDEADLLDEAARVDLDEELELVAAEWVVALGHRRRFRDLVKVARLLVVVEDDRLVELADVRHYPKTSMHFSTPRTRASTSSRVL
jgi:hypothetical protein